MYWKKYKLALFAIATTLFSIAFILHIIQLFIFFFLTPVVIATPYDEAISRAKKQGVDFDERNKLTVIQDLRNEGFEAYPCIHTGHGSYVDENGEKIFILSGIPKVKTVFCNESGSWAIYQSDEYGFNNPTGLWKEGADIVLVGDSYAHGACVKQGDDVAGQLRKEFPKTLNLGMSNSGPLSQLAVIVEYVRYLKPKVVLWMFYEGNDIFDLKNEKRNFILMKYIEEDGFSQNLIAKVNEIDFHMKKDIIEQAKNDKQLYIKELHDGKTINVKSLFLLRYLRTYFYERLHYLPSNPLYKPERLFLTVLIKAKQEVSSWGGELYFVNIPAHTRYVSTRRELFHPSTHSIKHSDEIISLVNKAGIPFIDFHETLAVRSDALSLHSPIKNIPGHLSKDGYALLSKTIISYLKGSNKSSLSLLRLSPQCGVTF